VAHAGALYAPFKVPRAVSTLMSTRVFPPQGNGGEMSADTTSNNVRTALFISPEAPIPGAGGGGLRSASLLQYLKTKYEVEVFSFHLPHHSKSTPARIWRNGWRFLKGTPPLLDRFAGFESQLTPLLNSRHYALGVIEHFWCAPYARILRPHCDRLVLDLHNIESELARTHARALRGLESRAMSRFANAYQRLEREWLPHFDTLLVTSDDDRRRIHHPNVIVYPNALPEIARPAAAETDCIVFSGNLEYHPNVEAVRWFQAQIWPRIRERAPQTIWKLVGRNENAVRSIVAGDNRIVFTGPIDDAVATLAEAKVCVVPLLSGSGTRFKILEAWAAGRAVVSTSLGAEGLGAQHETHLLIADDAAAFGDAVVQLLNDPILRKRLGYAGREQYLDRFTWPAAWKALASEGGF
jgi:polysaccharide biosynthesis protein PslH